MATPLSIEGKSKREDGPRQEPEPDRPCFPHHWVCDTAAGPESDAYCKKCGVRRTFNNYLSRENVEALKKEKYERYLAGKKEFPLKPVVTELPLDREEVHQEKEEEGHEHEWEIGEPDLSDISHMRCRTCPVELRADGDGHLYDEAGNQLPRSDQVAVPGETGRAVVRKKKYDDELPQILARLETLGSIGALAREMGLAYSTCATMLKSRGVDISKYQTGRHGPPAPKPAAIAANPLDTQKEPTVQKPGTDLPKTLATLLEQLPVPPEKQERWKAAFNAAFDLEYGP